LGGYKLTIRHGPKVDRESHPSLTDAVDSMRSHVGRIRSEGGLPEVTMFRHYEPGARVHARLEISTGGLFRGRDAGIDVMGDGSLIPFSGGVVRKPLEPAGEESPFDAVRGVLTP